jgi:putative transcriptional regulator
MRVSLVLSFAAFAVVLCRPPVAGAQSMQVKDLRTGKLLVAPRDSPDPNFAKTVVLLVDFDEDGALGLMINQRTKIPLSRALGELKAASNRSDPVYLGGPVDASSVLALLRANRSPGNAKHVLGDVFLVSSRSLVEKALTDGADPDEFHAYVGYCGWGAGQLENEVNQGAWYIVDGAAKLVFDSDPGSLWSRLIARTDQRVAQNKR